MDAHTLLNRLDAIGEAMATGGRALALLGMGSVGTETARLDAYSDLDFFVVAVEGHKAALLADLGWLDQIHPIAYAFQNTPDGYKLLYADGVLCEFAVFEVAELTAVSYSGARVVWQAPNFDAAGLAPANRPPQPEPLNLEWQLGEALTNLYVGLTR